MSVVFSLRCEVTKELKRIIPTMLTRKSTLVTTTENRLSHPSQKFFLNKNPYIHVVPEPVEGLL